MHLRWNGSLILAAAMVLGALAPGARAAGTTGELDTSFGTGGVATAPDAQVWALAARASDGAIATGGARNTGASFNNLSTQMWSIRRYTSWGQVDTSFGTGGLFTRFGDYGVDQVYGLAFDGSGRLLAAGIVRVAEVTGSGKRQTTSYVPRGVVLRLDAYGAVDTTFGTGGQVVLPFPAYAMALLPGGKILVSGPSGGDPAVARLLPDGALDTTYGTGGIGVDARSADACGRVMGVAVQGSGAAVLAWRGTHTFKSKGVTRTVNVWHVTRMTPSGSPDTTFASAQREDHFAGGVVVGPDDRVYANGVTDAAVLPRAVVVTAADANGVPDSSFGVGGASSWASHATQTSVGAPVLGAGGTIVIPSHFNEGSLPWRAAPVRLLADGTLDASFGPWGEGDELSLGNGVQTRAWGLTLAPDGGILMVGDYTAAPSGMGTYVARYVP